MTYIRYSPHEELLIKIAIFIGLVLLINFIATGEVFAATSTDFKDEFERGENSVGVMIRIFLYTMVGIAGGKSIASQNFIGVAMSGGAALAVHMLGDWINKTFTAII